MKILLLVGFIFFSAFAVHNANQDALSIRATEEKSKEHESLIGKQDRIFMQRAIDLSSVTEEGDHAHLSGSIVVKDGKIIGEGINRVSADHDPSAHAEVEAIRNACKNISDTSLAGSTIYTSAKSCPMCISLIYMSGIERIYYGENFEKAGDVNTLSVKHIFEAIGKPQFDRPIPEIAISGQGNDNLVKNYESGLISK